MRTVINRGEKPFTHLSLFSGIGGADLAAERCGFETIAFVEKDEYCQKVLAKHWPEVPIYDDVTTFDGRPYRGLVNVLSGGFPCQDVSAAGKQVGITGERSGLFSELIRVACEVGPDFIVMENVPGLISGGGIGSVLGAISEIGFDAEWVSVRASQVAAPQHRERVFIVAYPSGQRLHSLVSQVGYHSKNGTIHFGVKAEWNETNYEFAPFGSARNRAIPDCGVLRVANGVPPRMDAIKALGNAIVPAQIQPIFEAIAKELTEEKR